MKPSMDAETKQYLTETLLVECWHEWGYGIVCKKCKEMWSESNSGYTRTFDTRDDMMDLYEAIKKAGKWRNFVNWAFNDLEEPDGGDSYYSTASIAWLFCLSGEGYEDRCQMVEEFWRATESSADSAGRREG